MGLFDNKQFVLDSFIELIKEEKQRIIQQKLASKDQVNELVGDVLQTLSKDPDLFLKELSDLHLSLKNIKLTGDLKTAEIVACGCSGEGECCKKESTASVECACPTLTKISAEVNNTLEQVSYELGSKGDHENARLVEKTANKINQIIESQLSIEE